MPPVLTVKDLGIRYRTGAGNAQAIDGISFEIKAGEYLGLVGESGCGKSTVAKAVIGILPDNGAVTSGSIQYKGRELIGLAKAEMRRLRWADIALVPQSAMNGFDPVYTVEQQLHEAIAAHRTIPRRERAARIDELFAMVGLEKTRLKDYPHQFSGGMRQRAMIAMAMVLDPTLVVADEPTTGLDVIVQDQILHRIKDIHVELGKAMLLITHDMAVVAENCDKIAVMYAGRIVEHGGMGVFRRPFHPYTMGLCNAFPDLEDRGRELISIPGAPPSLLDPPRGCRFHDRCPFATSLCGEVDPPLAQVADGQAAACHYADRADEFRSRAANADTWRAPALAA